MSKREPKLLISDILESAHKIIDYTAGQSFENFIKDSKTVDAVIRNFEIIGEAANRLPEEFKDRFPEIDWCRIRGFRNPLSMIILALTIPLFGRSKRLFSRI